MCAAFRATCTEVDLKEYTTRLTFIIDDDDPALPEYQDAQRSIQQYPDGFDWLKWGLPHGPKVPIMPFIMIHQTRLGNGMCAALNEAAVFLAEGDFETAIGFMGDDHRPRTVGWDTEYLRAIADMGGTGIVYGDDGFQGANLPTQVAMSTGIIRTLGHMAPPELQHLYIDNYWRELGEGAGCLTYLPDVLVEHMHPAAGKGVMDDNYRRVNAQHVDQHDHAVLADYRINKLPGEIALVRSLRDAEEAARGTQIL